MEKLECVKPNGRPGVSSSMQALHELEMLSLGIAGKRALWIALQTVPEIADRTSLDFSALAARAQDQFERIEAVRLSAARAAFHGDTSTRDFEGSRVL